MNFMGLEFKIIFVQIQHHFLLWLQLPPRLLKGPHTTRRAQAPGGTWSRTETRTRLTASLLPTTTTTSSPRPRSPRSSGRWRHVAVIPASRADSVECSNYCTSPCCWCWSGSCCWSSDWFNSLQERVSPTCIFLM